MLSVGVLWCTYFDRSGNEKRRWRLSEAYRPACLFAGVMQKAGHGVQLLVCDEELTTSDLDGKKATLHDDVEFLYVTTHGTFTQSGFEIFLNTSNWIVKSLGQKNLSVAVFDTCWLIDRTQAWKQIWAGSGIGSKLRLLLGFEGQTVIDRGLALRGKGFAENLTANGNTFADAWINAVRANAVTPYAKQNTKAVAIGIGKDVADAKLMLDTMSLANMHGVRAAGAPEFLERY